jgi:hypothetical protein
MKTFYYKADVSRPKGEPRTWYVAAKAKTSEEAYSRLKFCIEQNSTVVELTPCTENRYRKGPNFDSFVDVEDSRDRTVIF